MKGVSALICEFNPLHTGHEYILSKLRENGDVCVCIMSGNFVQRGECAVFDKYSRAQAALKAGADLVVELPFPWSAAPAEFFAFGAVSIAKEFGAERIVFGSECADIKLLEKAAKISSMNEFAELEKENSKSNVGCAKLRELVAKSFGEDVGSIFSSPNDMLATEYIKSASKLGYEPVFEAVKREQNNGYVGASAIRKMLFSHSVSESVSVCLERNGLSDKRSVDPKSLYEIERIMFRMRKNSEMSFDSKSGILSRLKTCADKASSGEEMFLIAATKKYTNARIRRAALFSVLSVNEDHLKNSPCFTVLLGATEKGRRLLKKIKGDISVITKPADADFENEAKVQYEKLKEADALYALCMGEEASYFVKSSPNII